MSHTPSSPRVILDACVLMSGTLRRLLLRLGRAGALRPGWSERIGGEWRRNAARIWGTDPAVLQAEWDAMQADFPHAMIAPAPEHEAGLRYSDAKDWHVIGAARAAHALDGSAGALILTWNLKDFSRSELRRMGLNVMDPDRYLCGQWDANAAAVRAALAGIPADARSWGHRPEPLADTLRRERLYRLQKLALADRTAP